MPKEFTSTMSSVPQKQTLRTGQKETIDLVLKQSSVNAKLPTGYGKTYAFQKSFEELKILTICDRMLVVLPTEYQREQFKDNNPRAIDISVFDEEADRLHLLNKYDTFIISIQALTGSYFSLVQKMMSKMNWFLVIDEYHHYGAEKSWGKATLKLPYVRRLCLSATPFRPNEDEAFGKPDIDITYQEAYEEGAVKKLIGHSYNYIIDFINSSGEPESYTTRELFNEFGEGDKMDKSIVKRKMRWSPKYISPLVLNPIARMSADKARTGKKLQAIFFCASVAHAELVCKQINTMYKNEGLVIEWVGEGIGATERPKHMNKDIMTRFLKNEIDILCNYGRAGEGVDTVNVSEVIHLNNARMTNQRNQFNGRAGRVIDGVVGNINFDSSSEYATREYTGPSIMNAFDNLPANTNSDWVPEPEYGEYREFPETLDVSMAILNIKLDSIKSTDPQFKNFVKNKLSREYNNEDIEPIMKMLAYSNSEDDWDAVKAEYVRIENKIAEEQRPEAELTLAKQQLNSAMTSLVGLAIRKIYNGYRVEGSVAGDIKKRINAAKRKYVGKVDNNIQNIEKHYEWVVQLQGSLIKDDLPVWLR